VTMQDKLSSSKVLPKSRFALDCLLPHSRELIENYARAWLITWKTINHLILPMECVTSIPVLSP
jgi:hypothetical protein